MLSAFISTYTEDGEKSVVESCLLLFLMEVVVVLCVIYVGECSRREIDINWRNEVKHEIKSQYHEVDLTLFFFCFWSIEIHAADIEIFEVHTHTVKQ